MRRGTEMTAGIPGVGLSGLFIIISALALPLARRTGTPHRRVATPFILGVVMTVCAVVTWQAIGEAVTLFHHEATSAHGHRLAGSTVGYWPAHVFVISVSIMILVLLGAEALFHLVGVKLTPTPPPVRAEAQSALAASEVSGASRHQGDRSSQRILITGTNHEQCFEAARKPESEGVGESGSPSNIEVAT
jgi:hypothetical protein